MMKKVLIFIFFFFITFVNVSAKEEYLKNILIDGVGIKDFDTEKLSYDLNVSGDKEIIKITYEYNLDLYNGNGSYGDVKLRYGVNELSYTLTNKNDEKDTITYKINVTREDLRSSENSLSSLTVANTKVELTDKLEYDVYVDNNLTEVDIKAVLKDQKSSFVSGYGERIGSNLVKLSGETTKVEVKVKAENDSIKTYLLNIIKKDYKNNDATLKSLKIDEINFNFKSNIYEYELSVNNEIEEINLNAVASDENATITYDKKYTLSEGINNIVIKVKAEDETVKEYLLKVTREKEVPLVNDIEITGIEFEFDSSIYEYEIETELKELDFKVTLNSETATSDILDNENLENGSVVKIEVKDNDKTLTYSFKIIKEELIEQEKNEEKESDNSNLENKETFLEKYELIIGLSVFAIGVFMLLTSILTRPKKSQIM